MSNNNRPPCIFCNLTSARTSDEHVLPHSWKKTFPSGEEGQVQVGRDRNGVDRVPLVKKQVTPYDVRVKRVCTNCNAGWMREMDEAIKELIFDLAWGKAHHLAGDRVDQLSTWCTKVALMRTHRDRGQEQAAPLALTHRFFEKREALALNSVQIARVAESESALSGNVARELRAIPAAPTALAEKYDTVHLVTFQIGQLFFQVGLSTSSEWSKTEVKRLLAAGRRNRTGRVHVLRSGEDVHLENGLTQVEVMKVIETCRMVAQVSAHRETRLTRAAMASRAGMAG